MAKGSHATWPEGQPRVCGECGEPCYITRHSLFMRGYPVQETFHTACLFRADLLRKLGERRRA